MVWKVEGGGGLLAVYTPPPQVSPALNFLYFGFVFLPTLLSHGGELRYGRYGFLPSVCLQGRRCGCSMCHTLTHLLGTLTLLFIIT